MNDLLRLNNQAARPGLCARVCAHAAFKGARLGCKIRT